MTLDVAVIDEYNCCMACIKLRGKLRAAFIWHYRGPLVLAPVLVGANRLGGSAPLAYVP